MKQLAVLRKEFMDLTKDPLIAIVLNQFYYWSCRVQDYPSYIKEEEENKPNPQCGWIYKTSEQLIDETLTGVDKSTMCRYITFLLDKDWIARRPNPHNKWDKIPQYRLNRRKIEADLNTLGHVLPHKKNASSQIATSTLQTATTYTYTETTNINNKQKDEAPALLDKMMDVWKTTILHDQPLLTEKRRKHMESLLKTEFLHDLEEWSRLCNRVKDSSFLMGKGSRGWRIRLDWLLRPENYQKVKEGQYDDEDQPLKLESYSPQHPKVAEVLESIKDPKWKEWCTKMAQGLVTANGYVIENRLSLRDLESIADAWFIEYDDHLVWIGSHDQRVLSKIEDLRLKINWSFKQDYGEGRSFRTRLIPS